MTERWCDVCVLEAQILYATERAKALPDLRDRLRRARGDLPEMALRPDGEFPDELDDVVVKDVATFRAEAMSSDTWWMACYFANGEQVVFHVGIGTKPKRLVVIATDEPQDWVDIDQKAEDAQL